ncbi:unnamed protein product [Ranitomeya imitator]|uniref:Importin 5 n=1 Tax=Ranitomeya imitator TaxID=111125 RepID=A0ABN9LZB0_9NEOB|nr:unnamed protein product [Ranitomeya imitator]
MARTHGLRSLGADALVQDCTQFQLLYIFLPLPPDIQSGEEDEARGSSNHPNRTGLAQTYMVRRHHTTYSRRPLAPPRPPGCSITRPVLPAELRGPQFDGVAFETWVLTQAGLSLDVITTMIRARKPASAKIYYRTWKAFFTWRIATKLQDDNDVYILTKVADILHSIFSSYKEKVLPWFEQLLPLIVNLIDGNQGKHRVTKRGPALSYPMFTLVTSEDIAESCPHRPWPDRQWGLCIFDDIIEHCSPTSFQYAEYFLRPLLQSICDNSPEVRQAAAYGVGVMAQFGGDNYRPFCTEAVPLLVGVIQAPDSKTKENINATENCISAVGKIMKYRPDCVNVDEVLPHWLSWLPLHEDKEEAVHTFNFLCDLLESNNPIVLGPNNSNLPRIFSIIADGGVHESVKNEDLCGKRLANVVRQVQASGGLFTECVSQLNPVQQKALQDLLSTV